ncbi:uncharacterized protein DDB_G0284459-like [Palaemon carinicauda]|uniref:uncharacterized protein DDB_G0284459-like n=1 Tax=Palaemon carinicauda TaxID=392227 RepID=UPI0035B62AEB
MVVSDQEIDQLYAERYRLDQLFQNSPEFQDSLENSSAADSRSGISQRSRASRGHGKKNHHHPSERVSTGNNDGRSPRSSPSRRKDVKGHHLGHSPSGASHSHSPSPGSQRWPQISESPKVASGRNTPRSESSPVRRPQPPMQPGFSYIYPNADASSPFEKKPLRRYSFLGNSNNHVTDTVLPFKGKLEYFDRLSRGSTPEPVISPFSQGHRRGSSPSKVLPISLQSEGSSPMSDAAKRSPFMKLHRKPSDEHISSPNTPVSPASHGSSPHLKGNPNSAGSSPVFKENTGPYVGPVLPPLQILFEDKLSKRNKSPQRDKKPNLTSEPSPVHRRRAFMQLSDIEDISTPPLTPKQELKSSIHNEQHGEDQVSDKSENISRLSSFAEIKKNEQKNNRVLLEVNRDERVDRTHSEDGDFRENKKIREVNHKDSRDHDGRNERNARNFREEKAQREDRNHKETKGYREERSHREDRLEKEYRHQTQNATPDYTENSRKKHVPKGSHEFPEVSGPTKRKTGLQRHVSSPAIDVSRKGLSAGQSKISDSVAHITDSMSQLRRSLSKRVGRSVSRSFSKSITRSFARKYKRQYDDDFQDDSQGDSGTRERQPKKRNARPTLSDTFSTLRRSNALNYAGAYHALFGNSGDEGGKGKGEKQTKDPKSISDIHRFFHAQDLEGDSRSQKSYKSSSLPHPIDASVRDEVSLQEKHPEKFWTFTTSVVLPDYDPKPAYPDHPERDSLDGHLPGSSHGTGNPPPPPAPPSPPSNTNTKSQGNGFTKGPNAKNKKHKKLKNESDETGECPDDPVDKDKKKDKGEKTSSSLTTPKDRDMEAGGGYRPKTEPYTYMWVVMSSMYGKMVVLLMLAFCLTEVLDNDVLPLTFQGVFLMYLYVGSIVAIMCIYVSVIIDNCPSMTASKENLTKNGDPESGSITSFGTLKRAHISRSKTSRTSFYLRVGALVFGLGTLISNGLEIAMHSTMKGECVEDIVFAHPILQALFTFLQMHFLFVNSEVIVEKFGQVARFGFMHLVATNIAIWIRMVVWDSAIVWIQDTYENKPVTEIPKHAEQVLRLYSCLKNNSLGRLWTNAQPYLFPFLVEYSLIAAAVTYIMWCNVGKERLKKLGQLGKSSSDDSTTLDKRNVRKGYWKVDCRSASKGLFLGLLCLVGGIVVLIIFFVMKDQEDFKTKMFWISNGTQMIILSLSVICTVIGFLQIPKLSVSTSKPLDLDHLLLSVTIVGVYLFSLFGMIVGGISYSESESLATFCVHGLLFLQVSLQGMLVAEASRRTCTSRYQMLTKPGRQVITFLLFSNITLWILDTFMTYTSISQQFQFGFYGLLAWGIISRITLPLLILYRFHSAVILVEIWKNTYRTKAD